MSELIHISSEYDLIQTITEMGKNYFGEDLSTQRIGMFGLLTESLAHMYGSSLYDSSVRANEYLPKTAMKRSTLEYAAYKIGLKIPNATPTSIHTFLGVKSDDIINFGKVVSTNPKTYKLVLEKDLVITINNYVFKPEYDIELTALWSEETSQYVYSTRYLGYGDTDVTSTTDYVYPEMNVSEDIQHEHIPCYRTGNKTKVVLFRVQLKQLTKTKHDYVVTENDTISLTGIDFDYTNQFSYFNIYYKESDSSTFTFMKAVPKYDTDYYEENVIYYEVLYDEHKVRFDFTGFQPQYNSTFRIEIFSTLGSEVNDLEYVGNGSDIQCKIDSPDSRHTYSGISLACIPFYTNQTGADNLDMDGLRSYVIKNTPLLNAVITENDIGTFLNVMDGINEYYIRKVRSDLVNMVFDINSKIKTKDGGVIPSRCVNVDAPRSLGTFWSSGTELEPTQRYCSPYNLAYTDAGIQVYSSNIGASPRMTCVDTDTTSPINFRIDHVDITRNIQSDTYKMTVNVMTDGDYHKALKTVAGPDGNVTYVNTGNVKKVIILRGFVYENNATNIVKGIFDFEFKSYSDDIFVFEADLKVDPYMDSDNNTILRLKGMNLYNPTDINAGASDINMDKEFIIDGALYDTDGIDIDPQQFRFGIGCYYLEYAETEDFEYVNDSRLLVNKIGTGSNAVFTAVTGGVPGSTNLYPMYTGICEYNAGTDNFRYRLCDVYSNTSSLIDLYVDMTDIIRIDISTDDPAQMLDVPCVEIASLDEYEERLRDIIFDSRDLLSQVKGKLLNNFDTDYRFFNTSGPSNYFTIAFSNGSNAVNIGDLELSVVVYAGLTENYATLDTAKLLELKQCIKKHIEQIFANSENNKLYMGNVLTNVMNDMSEYIKYIELESINGFQSQYRLIQYNAPTSTDAYVSEFISVPLDNIVVNIE